MPNPTNNKAQVTLQLPKADKVNLRVFDAVGKQVYQHNSNTAIQNYQHQLDFSDMPRGMYLISLQTSEGMISRQLIVQ
ncbi:MAG: T9SS type A sorting domain-containing protein [Chitinophagales bacterium]|nr:T9SS type A sorting domain-containing protein [Chitinophagales bacterium]